MEFDQARVINSNFEAENAIFINVPFLFKVVYRFLSWNRQTILKAIFVERPDFIEYFRNL